jgi:hypothetical protein
MAGPRKLSSLLKLILRFEEVTYYQLCSPFKSNSPARAIFSSFKEATL